MHESAQEQGSVAPAGEAWAKDWGLALASTAHAYCDDKLFEAAVLS